jgi:hypothetical protein
MCKILSVCIPNACGSTHYVPLDHSQYPDVLSGASEVAKYNPAALPLHTEEEFLNQAHEVQSARNATSASHLSQAYGIKGVPILSSLKSLSFPLSFPYDFMHLNWEKILFFCGQATLRVWMKAVRSMN